VLLIPSQSPSSTPAPTATKRSSRTATRSGSTAPQITIWASAWASTSASAPTWPGSSWPSYKHLIPRIEEIELAGPIERLHSSLVGGLKKLPLRYKLTRAAA